MLLESNPNYTFFPEDYPLAIDCKWKDMPVI